jgi:hypothetical protein
LLPVLLSMLLPATALQWPAAAFVNLLIHSLNQSLSCSITQALTHTLTQLTHARMHAHTPWMAHALAVGVICC